MKQTDGSCQHCRKILGDEVLLGYKKAYIQQMKLSRLEASLEKCFYSGKRILPSLKTKYDEVHIKRVAAKMRVAQYWFTLCNEHRDLLLEAQEWFTVIGKFVEDDPRRLKKLISMRMDTITVANPSRRMNMPDVPLVPDSNGSVRNH